jgi:hypothetical protein
VPFYDAHDVKLCRVLTDRGTEYCGNPEHHESELYLALEDVDHSRTKTKSPQTNGIVERFHKTVLDEFYRVAFRKKIYGSIGELQSDLDDWLKSYNEERPHQGRWCFGKTPMQTFLDATRRIRTSIPACTAQKAASTPVSRQQCRSTATGSPNSARGSSDVRVASETACCRCQTSRDWRLYCPMPSASRLASSLGYPCRRTASATRSQEPHRQRPRRSAWYFVI